VVNRLKTITGVLRSIPKIPCEGRLCALHSPVSLHRHGPGFACKVLLHGVDVLTGLAGLCVQVVTPASEAVVSFAFEDAAALPKGRYIPNCSM
jgi:hypothetical protein